MFHFLGFNKPKLSTHLKYRHNNNLTIFLLFFYIFIFFGIKYALHVVNNLDNFNLGE